MMFSNKSLFLKSTPSKKILVKLLARDEGKESKIFISLSSRKWRLILYAETPKNMTDCAKFLFDFVDFLILI